ncbi:hypothetical protein AZI87_12015 [Bdellovibrio bacteriovorus]|uniref:Uncharacterized protein n=1 Tax=Bdellovibrio bacteriovorus TaxID=959 RepID=A0A162G8F0_BDEBC|nr:hypothetical protein [Bdellovibrio bacteriovorus]KYG65274.1 hypothetical protein AZI87_12015 [Bdellovibrio bacteriovorus]
METEKLAEGTQPLNFDKIIQQSENNIAENTAPKRGRGRPPKPKPAEQTKSEQQEPSMSFNDDFKDVEAAEVIKPNEVEPLALELVKAPFDIVGLQTGIDVVPDDTEAKLPSYYLAKLIHSYLPDLDLKDPRKFNLVAFVISYALLGIKKMRLFAAKKREIIAARFKSPSADTETDSQPSPQGREPFPTASVSAASYLSRVSRDN